MTNQNSPLKGFKPIGKSSNQGSSTTNIQSESNLQSGKPGAIRNYQQNDNLIPQHTCLQCGNFLSDNSRFCPSCGAETQVTAPIVPTLNNDLCPQCGASNPVASKYCGICGSLIQQITAPSSIAGNLTTSPSSTNNPVAQSVFKKTAQQVQTYPTQSTFVPSPQYSPQDPNLASNPKGLTIPTVSKDEYKSYFKTGKFGSISILALIASIMALVFGGLILMMIGEEANIFFLPLIGIVAMVIGFGLHILSGFVGLVRLFGKGWTS